MNASRHQSPSEAIKPIFRTILLVGGLHKGSKFSARNWATLEELSDDSKHSAKAN